MERNFFFLTKIYVGIPSIIRPAVGCSGFINVDRITSQATLFRILVSSAERVSSVILREEVRN